MSRSIFGWDLPPGCTHRQIEEAFGGDDFKCCEKCEEECSNPDECERYKEEAREREGEEEKMMKEWEKDMNSDAELSQEEYIKKIYPSLSEKLR